MKRIDSFFKPVSKKIATDESEDSRKEKGTEVVVSDKVVVSDTTVKSVTETEAVREKAVSEKQCEVYATTSKSTEAVVSVNFPDIGEVSDYVFNSNPTNPPLTDQQRKTVLTNVLVPDTSFIFPTRCYGKRKLRFQREWMTKWEWLVYSPVKCGAYCKYCVLFSSEYAGKGLHQKVGSLVSKPFDNWKDATERFREHSTSKFHQFSTLAAENFLKIMTSKMEDVATQLSEQRRKEKEQNRAALRVLVETVILCGEQELPLRGDKDSGPLSLEKPLHKDGKFRALLRFRASYDETLRKHVINSPKNATYLSPDIQNEIIEVCGKLIQQEIVNRVNQNKYFAILGDETLDVSGKEQFSLCVRYTYESTLREDFLSFLNYMI